MPTTVYALCEPDLQVPVIRYVGKTGKLVETRFKEHLSGSHKKRTHLGYWLRGLRTKGEKPVLLILTEVPDNMGSAAEILYIRLAREGGMDLVNATDGGDGGTGARGPRSPEHCAAIGASKKGVPKSPEHRAAISATLKGRAQGPRSPEHCAAIRAVKTGVPRSPETRAAISATKIGVPIGPFSSAHCESLREAWILRKMLKFSDGGGI